MSSMSDAFRDDVKGVNQAVVGLCSKAVNPVPDRLREIRPSPG